jgi:hypothetical protein
MPKHLRGSRRSLGVLVATTLMGAGLLGVSLLPAASQQATTIRAYERDGTGFEKFINVNGKRKVAGDYVVEAHPLFRLGTKKRIGRDVVQLTIIRGKGNQDALFRAAGTFQFAGGKVEAAGYSRFSSLEDGAAFTVTGGTGDYAGATGTLTVRSAKRRTYFTLRLNP